LLTAPGLTLQPFGQFPGAGVGQGRHGPHDLLASQAIGGDAAEAGTSAGAETAFAQPRRIQ